jgi:hypothetical protein
MGTLMAPSPNSAKGTQVSTQALTSVAIDVVGQYHQAGQHLLQAYEAGVQRVASAVNERFAAGVQRGVLPLINDATRSSLISAQQRVAGFVVDQLRSGNQLVATINDRLADGAKRGIERLSAGSARIDAAIGATPVDTLSTLNLPAAKLSLSVASAVAAGAMRLNKRVAGANNVKHTKQPAKPKRTRRTKRV